MFGPSRAGKPTRRSSPGPAWALWRIGAVFVLLVTALGVGGCDGGSSETASTSGPAATAAAATATPQPTALAVAEPTWLVTTAPVGCHATPEAEATARATHPSGTIHEADQLIRRPDGVWHRAREGGCWVRTEPGPLRSFRARAEARTFALTVAPQPVEAPTFVVNAQPVGCHETASAAARIVAQHPAGTVQAMDLAFRAPDGTWHREVARGCWTRTEPGPVRLFGAVAEAEGFACTVRPPRRLANGAVLRDTNRVPSGGHRLNVENGNDRDAVAVLTTLQEAPVLSFYVRGGESVSITGIATGTYLLFFTIGRDWDTTAGRFGCQVSFTRFEDSFPFQVTTQGGRSSTTVWSVSLHSVPGGAGATDPVDPAQFPSTR
jgi:hypothetical protein